MTKRNTKNEPAARVIAPGDLIGSTEAARMLGITKASVTRRVQAGTLPALAKLDGPRGALVFDRHDVAAVAK